METFSYGKYVFASFLGRIWRPDKYVRQQIVHWQDELMSPDSEYRSAFT